MHRHYQHHHRRHDHILITMITIIIIKPWFEFVALIECAMTLLVHQILGRLR